MFELLSSFHHLHVTTTVLIPEEENSWHWDEDKTFDDVVLAGHYFDADLLAGINCGQFKHCMGSPPEYAVHEKDTYTDWFNTDVSNTGRWNDSGSGSANKMKYDGSF